MNRIATRIAVLVLTALVPLALVACGGGDSGGEDPQQVIDETFSNDQSITSGVLDLALNASAGDQGSFSASLKGPFQTEEGNAAAIPQLDWTVNASGEGAGQSFNFDGGLTVTEDNAYVTYQGQAYEVGKEAFKQAQSSFESQAGQSSSKSQGFAESCKQAIQQAGGGGDESACEIDFSAWLTNLSNDGTSDVEGTDTDHISADVDIDQMFSDIGGLITAFPASGLSTSGLDPKQVQAQLEQVKGAVQSPHIDVYSGTDDHLLRKLDLSLTIDPSEIASGTPVPVPPVDLEFSITFSDVNQSQTVEAPSGAKPISDLLSQLGLGGLGPLSGVGGSSLGGGTTLPGGGSASAGDYNTCIQQATSPADYKQCLKLLQ